MKKIYRLKSNIHYKQVYKKGSVLSDKTLTLVFVKNNLSQKHTTAKFGFNISGKYGKAVKRNKLRRQLKSICAEKAPQMQSGTYVFRPRFFASEAPEFCVLKNSAIQLLEKTKSFDK